MDAGILHGFMTARKDLFGALLSGSISRIKDAIKAGADVNTQDDEGDTPLIKAVIGMDVNIVKTLLENKADPNIENFDGATALDYASLDNIGGGSDRTVIVSALQKAGGAKGSHNKGLMSSDHKIIARVQRFGSDADSNDIHVIEGTVVNLTDKELSYVEIDANFQYIGDVVDSGVANIQNLGPHESWHFKITSLTKDTDEYKLTKLLDH